MKEDDLKDIYEGLGDIPGNPPNESTGECTIVKTYRTVDKSGNIISDDGTFYIHNVSSSISIEDEVTYKIKSWKISNTVKDKIKAGAWETEVPPSVTQNGTSPLPVLLTKPETCLYILLEKVDGAAVPSGVNYVLSESTITRQIHLSTPDNQGTMPKIAEFNFIWSSPAHKSSCSGHNCYGYCSNWTWLQHAV